MAKFLMELCLQDYSMLQYLPSQQAASALYLSIKMYDAGDWVSNCTVAMSVGISLAVSVARLDRF